MKLRALHMLAALDDLRHRATSGVYGADERFTSARGVARTFGVSYQTVHRLLQVLVEEGVLERRPQSGTFIAGE